ncbi:fosfomycin resistance glutathione transferase [Providencia stuartii]|uniref:fosfomycin resistance glutathione transferase n=1 Tax=Providencia stuartii TaxID=588 RepID=UPI0018C54ADF|nr:fosfomycin resistance glutathione transferase [Providencia stuartii]MBG5898019.1 fosfomycin resistance glutathione transferase [Providencia stuartii]
MLIGINHLTLAVSDIQKSISFYQTVLGMQLHASWERGAYLTCGALWGCLSYDPMRQEVAAAKRRDYTHYAFTVSAEDFSDIVEKLHQAGVTVWKDNRSEGDSFYFLDPDGHQLEIHVGSLIDRLKSCRKKPYDGMVFYS